MEISSEFVGAKLKPFETEVTWRRAMNFAAAVGDNNPAYFDDERQGGIIAPPMLSVALTWAASECYRTGEEAQGFPHEARKTQVHFTENLVWHRPLRPGDRLIIEGEVVAIVPHLAGTYLVIRFTACDQTGDAVFVEESGAILRGVRCSDAGKGSEGLLPSPSGPGRREPIWEVPIPVSAVAAHVYDGCADISFPIHTSNKFARSVGLPGTILHGTATLAMAAREIVNREAAADPTRLKAMLCRFTGMVLPGTTVTLRVLERVSREGNTGVHFIVLNDQGRRAISNGFAELKT
ncbi:MAG: MaoC family dehydratase N-terminal domain-containing protein [Candidatus Hydrogenedentes bacterium]|nr:MaoC family dehydratase N-terminal domain-containing protein [Candidatus Hydrogenedentota bacterium]